MNNLVYLSYGQGPHVDQLVYSVMSVLHIMGRDRDNYRIIIYTDDPTAFSDLPVRIEPLGFKLLADWAGPFDFNHRRKIFVIKDALEKFGGRLGYCDSDTYFLKHPCKLFTRVRPRHTVMHIKEGYLCDCHASELKDFLQGHSLQNRSGHRWNITPDTPMFNAGVIGLHEADISLLDEVALLTDQIYPNVRLHTIEQFAFSACFKHYTRLHQSYDVIHHYWPPPGRALFREELHRVLHDPLISSPEERFRRLLPHRPRQHISDNRAPFGGLCKNLVGRRRRMYLALRRVTKQISVVNVLKQVATAAGILNRKT
jgi:hypothetical protein